MLRAATILGLVICASCKKSAPAAPDAAPAPKSAVVDAGIAPEERLVDLLHTVDTIVAVSSKVDNPKDFPEHLVDGKAETAWNGKTGDLVGGWIAFRVPQSLRVKRIELTCGFDKKNAEGDLFEMNHRITKVRISSGAKTIKEAELEPNKRGLQAIEIDEPGGDFKIEVLAVKPGTKANWKELTVSELRVIGTRGNVLENPAHIPKMLVGSLEEHEAADIAAKARAEKIKGVTWKDPPRGPFPTPDAMCKAYLAASRAPMDAYWGSGDRYPGKIEESCGVSNDSIRVGPYGKPGATFAPSGRILGARTYSAHDIDTEFTAFAVQTKKGWFRTEARFHQRWHGDPGCGGSPTHVLERIAVEPVADGASILAIVIRESGPLHANGGIIPTGTYARLRLVTCRADLEDNVTCEKERELGKAETDDTPSPNDEFGEGFTPKKWNGHKKLVIGPTGETKLEPAD